MKEPLTISKVINRIAHYMEIVIAFLLFGLILYMLARQVLTLILDPVGLDQFEDVLGKVMNMIIGLEFTRMLCRHKPETIIDVVLFAVARQMIIDHTNAWFNLTGAISIATLFAVRMYLVPDAPGRLPAFLRRRRGSDDEEVLAPSIDT